MSSKLSKHRCSRRRIVRLSEGTRYPFNMQDMVKDGIITIEQRDKFMTMLTGHDESIEQLAVSMLQSIRLEQKYPKPVKHE